MIFVLLNVRHIKENSDSKISLLVEGATRLCKATSLVTLDKQRGFGEKELQPT